MHEEIEEYPLILGFDDTIVGKGYGANVRGTARVLAENRPEEGWWFHSITPSGFSARGDELIAAYSAFRDALHRVLVDLAYECPTFESFAESVRALTGDDAPLLEDWRSAVDRVRQGKVSLPGISRVDTDSVDFGLEIQPIELKSPTENRESLGDAPQVAA